MSALPRRAILVVDDELFIRVVAADILEDACATVFEAGDAEEALAMLDAHHEIALVFTDVNMPGSMDGIDLAASVHRTRPAIQWIVTSGRQHYRQEELPNDATFLPKPYRPSELIKLATEKLHAGDETRDNSA